MMGYEKYYERAMQGRNVEIKSIDNKISEIKTVTRFNVN